MSEQPNKTILKLDASLLRESSCNYRWYMLGIEGYQSQLPNNDTQYGSAGHKFIYTMYMTNGAFVDAMKAAYEVFDKPCIIKPTKKHLTKVHLSKTCLDFWQNFETKSEFEVLIIPNDKCFNCHGSGTMIIKSTGREDCVTCTWCNGKGHRDQPMVEITFSIPIYEDDFLIILIEGTIDKFGKIKNGAYCFGDNKFTSSWDIQEFFRPYELSNQLKLYHWAIKRLGKQNPDSRFAEISRTPIGMFIDGIFMSSSKDTRFERSFVRFIKPDEEEEFEKLLYTKAADYVTLFRSVKHNEPSRNGLVEGLCHNGFGRCRFFDICAAPDDIARQHVLRNQFIKRQYDPMLFGKD